ncbi:peptide transporter family 1 isoform X2 [Osmia bicornis bicornis]|uniref:peptide transporter family 1 isoform X2 n=2 Tax=Osmia bicornis bicornis TaxID=1437191 RepID=UPI0010F43CB0|nr:peptide transporter family 1 isoform X2 [Osmia bicornis bicornis]
MRVTWRKIKRNSSIQRRYFSSSAMNSARDFPSTESVVSILTLYLLDYLHYNKETTITIYHTFTMLAYFFPVIGAILADSLLGKFRTIFYLSIIYAIGQIIFTISATPVVYSLSPREFSIVGLLLIAIGTGGIKTCVVAFGGDQFVLPQQERYLSTFFSIFYFSINLGSLISSFLTPELRTISCFGDNNCYSLAFFVPTVLMLLSLVIFLLGKPLYKILEPKGNVIVNVSKCISHAIYKKMRTKGVKREHWLDCADDEYDRSFINDIKSAFQVMKLFLPIPIFWALFDQQGTRWTMQARRMNGAIGNFILQPDQMQVINPLLVLTFIPLFEVCIYPLMNKIGLRTPLRKLTIGGLLASLSFFASAIVELELEKTDPVLPSTGLAQLRLFNTLNCPVEMQIADESRFVLKSLEMWENKYIQVNSSTEELNYVADYSKCSGIGSLSKSVSGKITVKEATANSWVITPEGLSYSYKDSVQKLDSFEPAVRGLIYVNSPGKSVDIEFIKDGTVFFRLPINSTSFHVTEFLNIKVNTYDIRMNGIVKSNVQFRTGGVYTLVGYVNENESNLNVITVTEPNSMHILWLLPQYIIITMGEVMFSVTGLEFAFTQAPISMKSLLQATWLLTTAFGNLIVVIITVAGSSSFFSRMFYEFILFAGLMLVAIFIFAVMAYFYKYVEQPEEESVTEEIHMDTKNGAVNESYKDD